MKSWDLFDTLVAARSGGQAGHFPDQLFPIMENVRQVQPDDIVVSDYDKDPANAEHALRDIAGLKNRLVVTLTGKKDGTIWKTLGKIECHTGDNSHSDVVSPKAHGIPARLSTLSIFTVSEREMERAGFPQLARLMREARLTTFSKDQRALEVFQTQRNFPLLFLACIWLHRRLLAGGFRRVLMSSRDCCLWVELQQRMRDLLGADYDVVYFYTSRIARAKPTLEYLVYVKKFLNVPTLTVDLGGTGCSSNILDRKLFQAFPFALPLPFVLLFWYKVMADKQQRPAPEYLLTGDNAVEVANLAKHGKVLTVDALGNPILQRGLIDYAMYSPIVTMHNAFHIAMNLMPLYQLQNEVAAVSDEVVRKTIGNLFNNGYRNNPALLTLKAALGKEKEWL